MKFPKVPNLNKFGPKHINPGTGRLISGFGKNTSSARLPGRHALNMLVKGSPMSVNDYAKATPAGAGAPLTYQGIMDMGLNGIDPASGGAVDDQQET